MESSTQQKSFLLHFGDKQMGEKVNSHHPQEHYSVLQPKNPHQFVMHEKLVEHVIQRVVQSQKNPHDFGSAFQISSSTSNKYM